VLFQLETGVSRRKIQTRLGKKKKKKKKKGNGNGEKKIVQIVSFYCRTGGCSVLRGRYCKGH
jgi:hypothetical protein